MIRDDTPDGPGAESEISIEKIDTADNETSNAVSVNDGVLVVAPEEDTIVMNDNDGVESNTNAGYITTRVPPFVPITSLGEQSGMKYGEDLFLADTLEYIKSTYGQHYANPEKQGIQVFDLWDSLGSLGTTSRDTAIKYLARYGKKAGYNKKDLFKAIHYTIMLYYATQGNQ